MWLKFTNAIMQPLGIIILLLLIGMYYALKSSKFFSLLFLISGTGFLYSISIPLVSNELINQLEGSYHDVKIVDLAQHKDPKAIVALVSIDPYKQMDAYQAAAFLAKKTNLPILVSGNNYLSECDKDNTTTAVELMAKSLATDFGISGAIWVERDSKYLSQNVKLIKKVLDQNNIKKVFLISNAWRMSRVESEFTSNGIEVISVPIKSNSINSKVALENFTPSLDCFLRSRLYFFAKLEPFWNKIFKIYNP